VVVELPVLLILNQTKRAINITKTRTPKPIQTHLLLEGSEDDEDEDARVGDI
jgi:hypothetical protein